MTKKIALLAVVYGALALHAFEIIVPSPGAMISESDTIGIVTLSHDEPKWSETPADLIRRVDGLPDHSEPVVIWHVTFKEVLKGPYRAGQTVEIVEQQGGMFSFEYFTKHYEVGDFLMLGNHDPISHKLLMGFGEASAWPTGYRQFQNKSLAECVQFAKKALGLPLTMPAVTVVTPPESEPSPTSSGANFAEIVSAPIAPGSTEASEHHLIWWVVGGAVVIFAALWFQKWRP